MEHPNEQQRKYQAKFLIECPAEWKEFHERIFRIGNAGYIYHQLAFETSEKTSEEYYDEWLEGLPDNIRESMKKRGFEENKYSLPFTRYVNERNDVGMKEWMKEHLSEADYQYYISDKK